MTDIEKVLKSPDEKDFNTAQILTSKYRSTAWKILLLGLAHFDKLDSLVTKICQKHLDSGSSSEHFLVARY